MTDEQRAREIARNICVSLSTGFTHIVSDEGDVVSVETAILSALRAVREEERERFARMMDRLGETETESKFPDNIVGRTLALAGKQLAAAIRKGQP